MGYGNLNEAAFKKAVKEKNYEEIASLGKAFIDAGSESSYVLNEVINALNHLGRKKEIGKLLFQQGERKLADGYYDSAIVFFQKAAKYMPNSIEIAEGLSKAYEKKQLPYEAFITLWKAFTKLKLHSWEHPWIKGGEEESSKEYNRIKSLVFKQLKNLLDTAEEIKSGNVEDLLVYFSNLARDILKTDRCSMFIADNEKKELWTKVAHGVPEIRVPWDKGIVGYVFQKKEPVIIDDAYADPRFNKEVDKKTGYRTRNIIAVPMFDKNKRIVGVYQAINKKDGRFTEEDKELLSFLASYAAQAMVKTEPEEVKVEVQKEEVSSDKMKNAYLAAEIKKPLQDAIARLGKLNQPEAQKVEELLRKALNATNNLISGNFPGKETEQVNLLDLINKTVNDSELSGLNISVVAPETVPQVKANKEELKTLIENVLQFIRKKKGAGDVKLTLSIESEDNEKVTFRIKIEPGFIPLSFNEESKLLDYDYALENYPDILLSKLIASKLKGGLTLNKSGNEYSFIIEIAPEKAEFRIKRF
ncbi:GAF domain-containing protein [Desulfurobacterium sp.]